MDATEIVRTGTAVNLFLGIPQFKSAFYLLFAKLRIIEDPTETVTSFVLFSSGCWGQIRTY